MFIHWGVYSVLGDGEWVMQVQRIDKDTYHKLPGFFDPEAFDPEAWVSLAKSAGMKYITITSKHHDGFAMFDSKVTEWDIADQTRYGKDVLKMLAEECEKQDIKLFFYYSHLDWIHEDYWPLGRTGQYSERKPGGDWFRYLDFVDAQLTELLTGYGTIGGIWFDGWWDKKNADWRLEKTYSLIHKLQPAALIGNNHHQAPKHGEDFQMFEKDLPGHNTTGFNEESEVGELPLETAETMNNSWGFNLQDDRYKSSRELIQYLVKAAGYDANFLLNVGPMPSGKIQQEFIDTLNIIGDWMQKYGEAIYGTRGGPVPPRSWGVTTQKQNKVYVHILDQEEKALLLPALDKKILKASLFDTGETVELIENDLGLLLDLRKVKMKVVDLIVVLEAEE